MRRKERALVIIQRASAIAAVAVFVLWVASMWWEVNWSTSRGYEVNIHSGRLGVMVAHLSGAYYSVDNFGVQGPGCEYPKVDRPFQWWFYRWSGDSGWLVEVPLWAFEVPTLALAAALWRRKATAARRMRAGQCVACGYDRSDIAFEHPCPECGAATPDR